MIEILIFVYLGVGVSSLFVSFLRSGVWAIPLLPFYIAYNLFWGDAKRKAEAKIFLKVFLLIVFLFILIYPITCLVLAK